jgi:membrane protein DedA with SNARE-associated domain
MNLMELKHLIAGYGYFAILIGTFLEGETILVLAGLAAHQGYLDLTGVILAAFTGSLCGDQFFFFLGRKHSEAVLSRRPAWKDKVQKVNRLLNRFQTQLIIGFRFLYGLRTVTPFVIGMSCVSTKKFVLLNAAGALVWAAAFGSGGYIFGRTLKMLIGKIEHYELLAFGLIALLGLLILTVLYLQKKRFN